MVFIRWGKLVPALKCFSDSVVAVSHTLTGEMEGEKMNNKRKKELVLLVYSDHTFCCRTNTAPSERRREKLYFCHRINRDDTPSFFISLFNGTFF